MRQRIGHLALVVRDYNEAIVREPRKESYGTVAVFEDLYGNLWDLLEPNQDNKSHTI